MSVLRRQEGYTVKYTSLPEEVPDGGIVDRVYRVDSKFGLYIILTIIKLIIPSYTPWGVCCEIYPSLEGNIA